MDKFDVANDKIKIMCKYKCGEERREDLNPECLSCKNQEVPDDVRLLTTKGKEEKNTDTQLGLTFSIFLGFSGVHIAATWSRLNEA